jgi:hypothetical protein
MSRVDDRQLALELREGTWQLLAATNRSADQDDRMIHMAHASAHHWRQCDDLVEAVRGEWLCSRVYSTLRRCEPALHHGRRALALCRDHAITGPDRAYAHEALARAHAILGNAEVAQAQAEQALAVPLADDERAALVRELATVPGLDPLW